MTKPKLRKQSKKPTYIEIKKKDIQGKYKLTIELGTIKNSLHYEKTI